LPHLLEPHEAFIPPVELRALQPGRARAATKGAPGTGKGGIDIGTGDAAVAATSNDDNIAHGNIEYRLSEELLVLHHEQS